jgi:hypothetical protein
MSGLAAETQFCLIDRGRGLVAETFGLTSQPPVLHVVLDPLVSFKRLNPCEEAPDAIYFFPSTPLSFLTPRLPLFPEA